VSNTVSCILTLNKNQLIFCDVKKFLFRQEVRKLSWVVMSVLVCEGPSRHCWLYDWTFISFCQYVFPRWISGGIDAVTHGQRFLHNRTAGNLHNVLLWRLQSHVWL